MNSISYSRDRVSALRCLPVRENTEIQLLDYRATPNLPTGIRPRTIGHGAVRLAGYILNICIVRECDGTFFETERHPYDIARRRRETIRLAPQIMADLFRLAEQKHFAIMGRTSGGRN